MKLELEGAVLDYEVQGTGEPVLFIHGAFLAEGFAPLLAERALAGYRRIRYYRRGYRSSQSASIMIPMARHAADARSVLEHAGSPKAHIVGHSFGGLVALQLALQAPHMVHSLALLEPPMRAAPGFDAARAELERVRQFYAAGDKPGAVDSFLRWVNGENYRQVLERTLGSEFFDQAVADCDAFFSLDSVAVNAWDLQQMHARQIACPVFLILGDQTLAFLQASHELLLQWFPAAQHTVIYRTGHMLQMERPAAVAQALARFFFRFPLAAA